MSRFQQVCSWWLSGAVHVSCRVFWLRDEVFRVVVGVGVSVAVQAVVFTPAAVVVTVAPAMTTVVAVATVTAADTLTLPLRRCPSDHLPLSHRCPRLRPLLVSLTHQLWTST
jgi:hypothetical protein